MQVYPQSRLIKIDAYSAVAAWGLLGLAIVLFLAAAALKVHIFGAIIGAITAFMLAALIHLGFALAHKCPHCGKHPTIQGFAKLHPSVPTATGVDGWARVVVDVVRKQEFACMHCGTRFKVADAA